jgi:hypothetical protein
MLLIKMPLPPENTELAYKQEVYDMSIRQIIFFGSVMAVIMSMCMSLAMTLINVGVNDHFRTAWFKGWLIGFVVSLPLSFVIPPSLQKIMMVFNI